MNAAIPRTLTDEALMTALQEGLELVEEPFAALAERLGASHEEVLQGVAELKQRKLLRRLSPIFDTRMLGYDSSLVAFRVPRERLAPAAAVVSSHPGVSHNYERTHEYNLWFTLAVSPDSRLGLEKTVELLAARAGAERSVILRALRTFKIGVKLDLDGSAPERSESASQSPGQAAGAGPNGLPGVDEAEACPSDRPVEPLSPAEQELVCVAQCELAPTPRPFRLTAHALGLSEAELLSTLRSMRARGLLRRVAAILHHRKVGFKANGMGVWQVPLQRVEECGSIMASFSAVSHCYQRATAPGWPYNLFTMVHGQSKEEVEEVLERIRRASGLTSYSVLYSTTEFKKQRVQYFTRAEREWEEQATG